MPELSQFEVDAIKAIFALDHSFPIEPIVVYDHGIRTTFCPPRNALGSGTVYSPKNWVGTLRNRGIKSFQQNGMWFQEAFVYALERRRALEQILGPLYSAMYAEEGYRPTVRKSNRKLHAIESAMIALGYFSKSPTKETCATL